MNTVISYFLIALFKELITCQCIYFDIDMLGLVYGYEHDLFILLGLIRSSSDNSKYLCTEMFPF